MYMYITVHLAFKEQIAGLSHLGLQGLNLFKSSCCVIKPSKHYVVWVHKIHPVWVVGRLEWGRRGKVHVGGEGGAR